MYCPVCGFDKFFRLVEIWQEYKLFLCKNCDVVFSYPMKYPGREWYEELMHEADGIYGLNLKDLNKKIIELSVATNYPWKYRQFFKALPKIGGKLLDIGCAIGVFLSLNQDKYEVYGIDINHYYIDFGKEKLGLKNLYTMTIDEFLKVFPQEKFDVITIFDVLEHLDNPTNFIDNIKKALKKGGYLALSLPCRDRTFFKDIEYDKPPYHLSRWSKKALKKFLEQNGFKIVTHKIQDISGVILAFISLNRVPILKNLNLKLKSLLYKMPKDVLRGNYGRLDYPEILRAKIELKSFFSRRKLIENFKILFALPVILILKVLGAKGEHQYALAKLKNGNS